MIWVCHPLVNHHFHSFPLLNCHGLGSDVCHDDANMATKAAAYWRKCCRDPSAWDFLSLAKLRLVVSSRPAPAKKYAHGEPPSQKKKIGTDFQFPCSKKKLSFAHLGLTSRPIPPFEPDQGAKLNSPSSTHPLMTHSVSPAQDKSQRPQTRVMCWKGKKSSYIAGLCQTHAFQLPVFLAAASYRIDLVR